MVEVTLKGLTKLLDAHPGYAQHMSEFENIKEIWDILCDKCREIRAYGYEIWNHKKPISEKIESKTWGDFTRAEYDKLRALGYIDKDIWQYFGIGNTTFQDWKKAMRIQRKYKRGKLVYG